MLRSSGNDTTPVSNASQGAHRLVRDEQRHGQRSLSPTADGGRSTPPAFVASSATPPPRTPNAAAAASTNALNTIDSQLRPLAGAIATLGRALDHDDVLLWKHEGERATLMRSSSDDSVQIGCGDFHIAVSADPNRPIEVNGEPATARTLEAAELMLRGARKFLVSRPPESAAGSAERGSSMRLEPSSGRGAAARSDATGHAGDGRTRGHGHDADPSVHDRRRADSLRDHLESLALRGEREVALSNPAILRHADRAYIDMSILNNYALNPNHRDNGTKAKNFKQHMGFDRTNSGQLRNFVLDRLLTTPGVLQSNHGVESRYRVDMRVEAAHGPMVLRTIWSYGPHAEPHLVTLFLRERMKVNRGNANGNANAAADNR